MHKGRVYIETEDERAITQEHGASRDKTEMAEPLGGFQDSRSKVFTT
jgi:hypothetical protein